MKVSEYATRVISTRPYKYQTWQTLYRDLKRLGIWDQDISEVTSASIRDVVETIGTQSTRQRLFITARSNFKDLNICQDLLYLEAEGKVFDMPTQEELEWLIERSKYRLQLYLCMFGGLTENGELVKLSINWVIPSNRPNKVYWALVPN